MILDKKNKSNKITFVLPEKIGKIKRWPNLYSTQIAEKVIAEAIRSALNEVKN